MRPKFKAPALLLAMGLPIAVANAQTTPTPDSQAAGAPPAAGPTSPQMGMMMGDMRQMMQMMGAGPGGMMGGGMQMMPGGPGGPGMGMGMRGMRDMMP